MPDKPYDFYETGGRRFISAYKAENGILSPMGDVKTRQRALDLAELHNQEPCVLLKLKDYDKAVEVLRAIMSLDFERGGPAGEDAAFLASGWAKEGLDAIGT